MGRMSAEAMLESTDLTTALTWHLTSNVYPSAPFMVNVALAAISACEEDDPTRWIELPVGVTWKDQEHAPANVIVDSYRLDVFIGE